MDKKCPSCSKDFDTTKFTQSSGGSFIGLGGDRWDFAWQAQPGICFDCGIKIGNGVRAAMSGDIRYLTDNET